MVRPLVVPDRSLGAHITVGGELVVSILSFLFVASLLGEYPSPEKWSVHTRLVDK